MHNLIGYLEVDKLTDEHIGRDGAVVYVNFGESSYPTFGTFERRFDHRTGEPSVALITDERHFAKNAEFPEEEVSVSSYTETYLYVTPEESPNA